MRLSTHRGNRCPANYFSADVAPSLRLQTMSPSCRCATAPHDVRPNGPYMKGMVKDRGVQCLGPTRKAHAQGRIGERMQARDWLR